MSTAPETTTAAPLIGHVINGQRVLDGGRTQPVYNPATGEVIRQVALAETETVTNAIAAAEAAFPEWRDTTPLSRARVMFRFKELVEKHAETIVALITEEHGKVLDDARGELQRGIENIEYACGAPELLKGEHSRNVGRGVDSWSEHQPLGVVAGITPSNFPAMVPLWMYPLALICGNTFVLKPSERDPSAALFIGELLKEAGLPDGVFNLVNGDRHAVETLLGDHRIQAVSFVGSTPVAEAVYRAGSENDKRVQALGSAKNHAVVMPDADLDNTISALLGAAYGSCGERCMAISVAVVVGQETGDALVAGLAERLTELTVGDGRDATSDLGPLITGEHRDRVKGYIDLGVEEGAELAVDGRMQLQGEAGFFLGPCLFDQVKRHMRVYKEEIFGPVLCVVRVDSLEDAMELIDTHDYGNGTCIFTRDGEAARYFSDRVQVGMVGINVPLPVPVAYFSFGGWKRSLFGDMHIYGPEAVRFYTRSKVITQRWPSGGVRETAKFSFPGSD
ncbi:MAG: methylmalonate-semialdehyde dehydrogenase (acylating) [Gammaproteobacteria bacterium]|nr:MAG: methylmalonate-semialdehyde dehydrogenase (acylating) [Gammaproteobacteria bacterium]